jgi:hypothetical protein
MNTLVIRQSRFCRVFHNSIHRYFVFTLRIALTSIKQLFSLVASTAERTGEINLVSPK